MKNYPESAANVLWGCGLISTDQVEYSGGGKGNFYADMSDLINKLERREIFRMLYDISKPEVLAAPEFGDAILAAMFCERYQIPLIGVKLHQKEHAKKEMLIGHKDIPKGSRVTVFTDVVNNGGSMERTEEIVLQNGYQISNRLTILRYGRDNIGDVLALTDLKTVLDTGLRNGFVDNEYVEKCLRGLGISKDI
jgi:orotate phosphoribosyltransferase